jgi:hypothetical protein
MKQFVEQVQEAKRQKVMKKMFAELQESSDAYGENTKRIIEESRVRNKITELHERDLKTLESYNLSMSAQNDALKAQNDVNQQRKETEKKLLQSELARLTDPKLIKEKQAQIDKINEEIEYRSQMNAALEQSVAYQALMNEAKLAELDAAKVEAEGRVARTRAELQITADQQRIQEATAENLTTVQTSMASLMEAFSPQNIASWATSGDPEAINKGFEQALAQVNALKDTGAISSEAAQAASDYIREQFKGIEGKELKSGDIQKTFTDMYANLQTNLEAAVNAGQFKEAEELQQRIASNRGVIDRNEIAILTYKAQAQGLEYKATKAFMDAISQGIKPEELDAFIAKQGLAAPKPPSLQSPKAFGGLVTKATRALIGEAGPELVMPLRRGPVSGSPGAESMIQDYLGRMGGGENRGKKETLVSLPVVINLDGRKVGEALVRTAVRSV